MLGLSIDAPEVQGTLMLYAYREGLKKDASKKLEADSVNLADLEKNELSVQSAAGSAWVETGDNRESLSSSFRAYADAHPYKRVDVSDEEDLGNLLDTLAVEKSRR